MNANNIYKQRENILYCRKNAELKDTQIYCAAAAVCTYDERLLLHCGIFLQTIYFLSSIFFRSPARSRSLTANQSRRILFKRATRIYVDCKNILKINLT